MILLAINFSEIFNNKGNTFIFFGFCDFSVRKIYIMNLKEKRIHAFKTLMFHFYNYSHYKIKIFFSLLHYSPFYFINYSHDFFRNYSNLILNIFRNFILLCNSLAIKILCTCECFKVRMS
jgi:hypothetical protein